MTLEFEGEEVTFDIPGWYVEGVASAKVFKLSTDHLHQFVANQPNISGTHTMMLCQPWSFGKTCLCLLDNFLDAIFIYFSVDPQLNEMFCFRGFTFAHHHCALFSTWAR